MSDVRREKGTLRKLGSLEEMESFAKDICDKNGWELWDSNYCRQLSSNTMDEYVIIKGSLYKIENYQRLDSEYDFFDYEKIDDNTYTFHTMYYDGGACLDEMIENSIK